MNKVLRNNRGSALLISLVLVGMLALVGLMAAQNSNTDLDLSFNQADSDEAFYLAEAGAKRAIAELMTDKTWRDGYADVAFGSGIYSVVVSDSTTDSTLADTVVVTATGEADEASATVQYEMVPDVIYPFRYAMFGDDVVDIRNSMNSDSYNSDSGSYWLTRLNTDGDIGSNGNIIVKNGAFVGGDVQTSNIGGLSVNPGATVTGDISDNAPEQLLPTIPQAEFDAALAVSAANDSISGTYTYDSATYAFQSTGNVVLGSGIYYFSSIILKNSATLTIASGANVTIYVTGDIELKNSASVNSGGDPSDLMIYSQGDFVLKNSGDINAVFYNPDGDADLRNSGEFFGSIIANNIVCHNSSKFHYDRDLSSIAMGGSGNLAACSFVEL
ncbi:MAG TPA: pilus assembly PilX N-terminal domain-containing protein [candidate division Zixibacteria bacterium]|nr:pilus assembly PilX N-terminal domain-containing protein [candidate division Zixibacteria bacterium]